LLQYSQQQLQVQQANRNVIQKTVLPKLTVWSTGYARGSGIKYDGTIKSTDGFAFSRYNYGIGLQLSVPILQFTYTRLQLQQQDAVIQSYQAQLQQTQQQLQRDSLNAVANMDNAMKVVKETPVQLNAANTAYRSMLSRYDAGLASFADLIQTQYALIKAETDVKQSYLDVWKALLQQAAVKGDVNIFLSQVK
jgi:outer membrane protein TolC